MKNSKKGFTLVELVVVIAILAILAAIAIPVVSNTINSSKVSGALSDAQTLELAIKEADAQIVAGDKSVYTSGVATAVSAVYAEKGIDLDETVTVKGSDYNLVWDFNDEKCYYVYGTVTAAGSKGGTTSSCVKIGEDASSTVCASTGIGASSTTVVASLFK